jgi:hypothetical protein
MKKIVFASLLALGTSTLLAGCGLIPPIDLGADPIGLNGQKLTSSVLSATGTGGLSTRVAGTGTASASTTFPDIDPSKFTLKPSSMQMNLELTKGEVSAACAPALNQTSIAIKLSKLTLSLSDGTTAGHSISVTVPAVNFNLNPTNGTISNLDLTSLIFQIDPSVFTNAFSIITTLPSPNTASVTTDIETTPALPGCTVSVTFGPGGGSAKL